VRVTLESTPVIVELDDGAAARCWEGATDTGIPVVALVAGILPQTHDPAVQAQFAAELEAFEAVAAPENPPISAPGY
jgi:hypothetical protein